MLRGFRVTVCGSVLAMFFCLTTLGQETPTASRAYRTSDPGRGAYQRAEQQRREAIERQLGVIESVRYFNIWRPYGYGPAFTPWPRPLYGYPHYRRVRQPIGHDKIWTGPNSYVYRSRYASPPEEARSPVAPLESVPTPEPVPPPPIESGPREF